MLIAGLDYSGVPSNLTFVNISETTLTVTLSIIDDDLVERPEVIYLQLVKLTTSVDVLLNSDIVQIEIIDNDCKRQFTKLSYVLLLSCLCMQMQSLGFLSYPTM